MCCVVTVLLLLGPRLALLVWWLIDSARFVAAFQGWILGKWLPPNWFWPLLGALILPWTTLAYLFVFPNGVNGLDWVWLGLGLLIDLVAHGGGGWRHRDRLRGTAH